MSGTNDINNIDDIQHWVIPDLVKRGQQAFDYYIVLYSSLPSYRTNVTDKNYPDLMTEKINCCYEETIARFGYINCKSKYRRGDEHEANQVR